MIAFKFASYIMVSFFLLSVVQLFTWVYWFFFVNLLNQEISWKEDCWYLLEFYFYYFRHTPPLEDMSIWMTYLHIYSLNFRTDLLAIHTHCYTIRISFWHTVKFSSAYVLAKAIIQYLLFTSQSFGRFSNNKWTQTVHLVLCFRS